MFKIMSNKKWTKILFYLMVYVEDIRWTDISTRSEYVVDIWILRDNRKMLITRVIYCNQLLAVARKINKQDDHTKFILSIYTLYFQSLPLSHGRLVKCPLIRN